MHNLPKAATGLLSGTLLTACLSWKTQPGFAAACLAVGVMLVAAWLAYPSNRKAA